ncbi:RHS repeat-associated core domain-containing protein [Streptomyces sp. NPDC017941]|uniref:RHS repeat-associated core domain-containing protein n=1 Tax=Streptomyces sp. NPDC017941 TaxID=3365018 RepID=UPI0037A6379A
MSRVNCVATSKKVSQPYRFAGGYQDPMGLYRFATRHYDPHMPRFSQPGPSGQEKNTVEAWS